MILTNKRLAALAATVGALAIGVPAEGATAQVTPGLPGFPALPAFPTWPIPAVAPVTSGVTGVRIATVVGPTVTGGALIQGIGAGGQVAAAAPQAISLLSNTAGPTVAVGS
jgi:hypothetical protein